jgi:hypothetical protein
MTEEEATRYIAHLTQVIIDLGAGMSPHIPVRAEALNSVALKTATISCLRRYLPRGGLCNGRN